MVFFCVSDKQGGIVRMSLSELECGLKWRRYRHEGGVGKKVKRKNKYVSMDVVEL